MESAGPMTRSKARQTQSPAPVSAAKSTTRKGARGKDATDKDQGIDVAKVLDYDASQDAVASSDLSSKDTPVKDTPASQSSPATPPQAEYYAPSPTGAIPGLTPIPAMVQATPDVRKGGLDAFMPPLPGGAPASYLFSPGVGANACNVMFHSFSKPTGAQAGGGSSTDYATEWISSPAPADTPVMGLVTQPGEASAAGGASAAAPTPPDFGSAPGSTGPTPTLTGSTAFSAEALPTDPPTSGTEAGWRDNQRSPSLAGGLASAAPATATPAAAVTGSIASSTPQSAVTPFEARMAEADRSPSLGPVSATPPAKPGTPAATSGTFGSPVAPAAASTPLMASPAAAAAAAGVRGTPKSAKKGGATPKTPASAARTPKTPGTAGGRSPGAASAPPSTGRMKAMMEDGPEGDDDDLMEDEEEVVAAAGDGDLEVAAAEGDVEMDEGPSAADADMADLDSQMAGLSAELAGMGVAAAGMGTPGKRTPAKSPGMKTPASSARSPAAALDATPSPAGRKSTPGSASSTGGSYSTRAAARAASASPLSAGSQGPFVASPGRTPYPTKSEAAAGAAKAHSNQAAATARLTTMVGPKKAAAYSAASSALQQSVALSQAAATGASRPVPSRLYEPTASSLAKCHPAADGPKPRVKSKVVVPSPAGQGAAAGGGSSSSSLGALKAQHKAALLQQKARSTVEAGAAERDANQVTDLHQMRHPKSATKAPKAAEASVDMSTALAGSDSEGEEVEQGSRPQRQSNKENEVVEALAGALGKMGVEGVVHQQGTVLRGVPAPTGKYKRFDEEEGSKAAPNAGGGGRTVPRNRPVALRGVAPPQGKHISFADDE